MVWVAHELGHKVDVDFTAYERYPDGRTLKAWLDASLHRKPGGAAGAEPGDVLLLRDAGLRHPLHVGIETAMPGRVRGVLHSWVRARGVVEHAVPSGWSFVTVGAYCYEPLAGERWDWDE